jgi:hypothetical protein
VSYVIRPLGSWTEKPLTPIRSKFKATWTDTLNLLEREIDHLGAPRYRPWILQIDVSERWIRQDGELYARATPASPRIRVCFDSRHGPLTYPCGRFDRWQDNARAVALALEALRTVDRYGVSGRGEQYRGWTGIAARPAEMSLEQAAMFIATWAEPDSTERRSACAAAILRGDHDALATAHRRAARQAHPDLAGGHADTMARLNVARDQLLNGARHG